MKLGFELLVISLGGACGAVLRYAFVVSANSFSTSQFPWGTFVANVVGCLLVGMLIGSGHGQKHDVLRLGFGVGFLGSLTTFSAFSAESVKNALDGNWGIASANVVLNLVLCLGAVVAGMLIAKKIWA